MLRNAGTMLKNIGKDIIDGLLNGLKNAFTAVTDWVKGAASSIAGGFKSLLGISSPSKVFAGFGKNIGEGLVQGMESMEGKIESQVGMLVQVPNVDRMADRVEPSRTVVYNAAPNQSLDAEQELMKAMRRARLVAQW
jgi:phage-related protein